MLALPHPPPRLVEEAPLFADKEQCLHQLGAAQLPVPESTAGGSQRQQTQHAEMGLLHSNPAHWMGSTRRVESVPLFDHGRLRMSLKAMERSAEAVMSSSPRQSLTCVYIPPTCSSCMSCFMCFGLWGEAFTVTFTWPDIKEESSCWYVQLSPLSILLTSASKAFCRHVQFLETQKFHTFVMEAF